MKYFKFLSLVALAVLMFPFNSQAQMASLENVSPVRAKLMVRNGALMVDVRETDEVAALAYDVENIINVPLSVISTRLSEIPKDKQLVIACRSGNRSKKAAAILMENGFTNLVNLDGGMMAWQAKDFAVIKDGKTTAKPSCCAKGEAKSCAKGASKSCSKAAAKSCAKGAGKACCAKKAKIN